MHVRHVQNVNLLAGIALLAAIVLPAPGAQGELVQARHIAAAAAGCPKKIPPEARSRNWIIGAENCRPSGGSGGGGGGGSGTTVSKPSCPDRIAADACGDQVCGVWGPIGGCRPNPVAPTRPVDLMEREWSRVPVPVPEVVTAPPRQAVGRVGLPEWFWLDPAQTAAVTRRAQAGPIWVELTARPQRLVITPGPGMAPVACPSLGTAYAPGTSSEQACTYTYSRSSAGLPGSAYVVTATVVWGGTWRGSGGAGGALTPIGVSTTFAVRIGEAQGLNVGGGR